MEERNGRKGCQLISDCFSNKSPTRCNNFPFYYPDVYLQFNMFQAFSRTLSGAHWLQWQSLVLLSYRGKTRGLPLQSLSSWLWAGKHPKHVELKINVRIINCKIFASGWWYIWIVRWCTYLQTLNLRMYNYWFFLFFSCLKFEDNYPQQNRASLMNYRSIFRS
jgi:hypothetical protein